MRKPLTPEQLHAKAIIKAKIRKEVMEMFVQIREEARILTLRGRKFGEKKDAGQ